MKRKAFTVNSHTSYLDLRKEASKRTFFSKKNTVFSATYASILNPCLDGNEHTYATNKEMKKIVSRISIRNIEHAFCLQVIFITEKKPQKERFLAK